MALYDVNLFEPLILHVVMGWNLYWFSRQLMKEPGENIVYAKKN